MNHPMMDEQQALEAEMRQATRYRYFGLVEKATERGEFSETHPARAMFDDLYKPFLARVNTWYDERMAGTAGRKGRAANMLTDFGDNQTLAFIFVKHLLNNIQIAQSRDTQTRAKLTSVVLKATMAIHDELAIRHFKEERPALLRRIVRDFNEKDMPRRRRRELMIKQFHTQQLEWQHKGWEQRHRVQLGILLVDLFIQATGVLKIEAVREGKKTVNTIEVEPEFAEAVQNHMENSADLFQVFYPCVVPPKEWSAEALVGGGYYTDNVKPYPLIKYANQKYLREMENMDMSAVVEPINQLQNTAWRINKQMLEVIEITYANNMDIKGLTTADPEVIPEAPYNLNEDEDIAKEYRRDCYMVHDNNRRAVSRRLAILRTISMANKFKDYNAIYFPYDLDFRGRGYPKVAFLNPQGTDYVKALLEFSEGKPLNTAEDEAYLAIAVANAWGHDKLPLQERVEWVEDNQDMLNSVAAEPFNDRRWMKAGDPFMALRGAMEWYGLCTEGSGYVSHMPVHFDATCSGLQHFSALLRDSEGGFFVNLTGEGSRQDIYAEVAKKAEDAIRRDLQDKDTSDIARVALELGITRSLCKRPVMIVPYAGTIRACMQYVVDYYKEQAAEGVCLPVDMTEVNKVYGPYISKHIWAAIASTVIAAREAMDWIKDTGRLVSKGNDTPVQWDTPDGFVVRQASYQSKALKVDTYLDGGRRIQSIVSDATSTLDPRKMSQSLSPNYIHSLDACHMRMSVAKAAGKGMSFAMIHDSFGVHASDMSEFLQDCIKPAFVEMYEGGGNLERFKDQLLVTTQDHEEVKPLPPTGTLDIQGVHESQFFFS